jgi:cytidine deaminase
MVVSAGGCIMTPEKLVELAKEAMTHAYVPYSGYKVGAALLCADGTVYQGCNIENAAYGPTNCAERTAFFKAVSEGEREFAAIAVAGGRKGEQPSDCTPCGICRQVLAEFCPPDFKVILLDGAHRLDELLPMSFTEENL